MGHLGGHDVRRVIGVRRDLHGELPAPAQAATEPGQQGTVIGHPLQRGVGEDDVESIVGVEGGDVTGLEPKPASGERPGPFEHRR